MSDSTNYFDQQADELQAALQRSPAVLVDHFLRTAKAADVAAVAHEHFGKCDANERAAIVATLAARLNGKQELPSSQGQ